MPTTSPDTAPRAVPTWLKIHLGVVALVSCLAVGRGLSHSMWRDETASALVTDRPFGALPHLFSNAEAGMLGFGTFLHRWVVLAGTSETALRLPSLIAAAVTVVAAGVLACRLAGALAGAIVPVALIAHPQLVTYYGIEARGYMASVMFVTLAALEAHRSSLAPSTIRYLRWAVFATAAVLFHLMAILAIVPQVLWLMGTRSTRSRATLPIVVAVVGLSAVGNLLVVKLNKAQTWIEAPTLASTASTASTISTVGGAAVFAAAVLTLWVLRQPHARPRTILPARPTDLTVLVAWPFFPQGRYSSSRSSEITCSWQDTHCRALSGGTSLLQSS